MMDPIQDSHLHKRVVEQVGPNAGCENASNTCMYGGADNQASPVEAMCAPYTWSRVTQTVTLLQSINSSLGAGKPLKQVTYTQGANWTTYERDGLAQAVANAREADVVIAVVGDVGDATKGKNTCAEGLDASSLDLPGGQLALLEAVAATGTPVVVVLIHGRSASLRVN